MWAGAGGPPNPTLLARNAYIGMIETAQNVADRYKLTREEIDAFALRSQQHAKAARDSGRLAKEIMPVQISATKKTPARTFEHDEFIRDDTTAEQLAWIKVAASHHAQYNPHALLKDVVTVEEVVNSPMISDPLHRLDCCVITDGGGAIVVVAPEIAARLRRPKVKLLGSAEFVKTQMGGKVDLTYSGARFSGQAAFAEAGVKPADIKYASIYDSFTITVLMQLEDLGFCEKGKGGAFVADGNLIAGQGRLPFNTDGGGLCSNHPGNRGGLTKVLEAVRQLRGEAHPKVQVKNCNLAVAHGTGGSLGLRHGSATVILERE